MALALLILIAPSEEMTQELLDLKKAIANQDLTKAMAIVSDLEVMSREDKIQKLQSHLVVLLVHLLKMQLERRLTNSWRASILNSLLQIKRTNRMGNKKTPYIKSEDWEEAIAEVMPEVYVLAATEVLNGVLNDNQVEELANYQELCGWSTTLLRQTYQQDANDLRQAASRMLNTIKL